MRLFVHKISTSANPDVFDTTLLAIVEAGDAPLTAGSNVEPLRGGTSCSLSGRGDSQDKQRRCTEDDPDRACLLSKICQEILPMR